ncbi:MAG: MlaD family protein [Bdellovibrionaceae bacterium]|nr:MlaD family protein [Pseudobdellovibrionaceae bacterium]MDW8189843.1 MlaD family protein [Pseudobdellovibrionaceae bacterium]
MKAESKVGILFVATVLAIIAFAIAVGVVNPFSNRSELHVMYNYAGGLDKGSPVRVMGIKVGRVKEITFAPNYRHNPTGEEVKLKVTIEVDKAAMDTIREDSQFFINMAGVIGEKYLEITPGSLERKPLPPNSYVRGEDPPRIDQLISQGYGLAGKLIELVNKNENSVNQIFKQIDTLLKNINKTLAHLDKMSEPNDIQRIIKNTAQVTEDLKFITQQIRSEKSQESFKLIHKLLFRLEDVDGKAIKKFFQEEGIKARIFN